MIILLSILKFVLFITWDLVREFGAKNEDVYHIQDRIKFLLQVKFEKNIYMICYIDVVIHNPLAYICGSRKPPDKIEIVSAL